MTKRKAEIVVELPKAETALIDRIYKAVERSSEKQGIYLTRIGASAIGEECLRKLFFNWRAFAKPTYSGRSLLIFDTGNRAEQRIVDHLRLAGLAVWDKNEDGKQFEYTDPTGHFIVKLDGVIKGVPGAEKTAHVLEMKTHNVKSFTHLEKHGLMASKPGHYLQIQSGMMLSKIERGLYVALCKDDENYYIERVYPDPAVQEKINDKIRRALSARMVPVGISDDASAFGCRFCDYKEVCTKAAKPLKTCRSCSHCYPGATGDWICELYGMTLTRDDQLRACEQYDALLKD